MNRKAKKFFIFILIYLVFLSSLYAETIGQSNALESAKAYLNFMSFSYTGLIDQLEYEGFTISEATYGVDNCGADWNEQAEFSAKSYLEFTSFSRQGLIEQLEYEGFTEAQAIYGVNQVYIDSSEQVVDKAKSYL